MSDPISLGAIAQIIVKEIATSVVGQSFQALRKKRLENARDILIEELQDGGKDIYEAALVDEAVAIVDRYMRAAQEGTARINLRLLAKVIAGQKQVKSLIASDFLYYADIIASLRREEMILLGCIYKHSKFTVIKTAEGPKSFKTHPDEITPFAYQEAIKELVPSIFSSPNELAATAGAITRTGLLLSVSAYGGLVYQPTPLLDKLNLLASIEDALAKEEIKSGSTKVA